MCEHCENPSLSKVERAPLPASETAQGPESGIEEEPWGGCEEFDVDEETDELFPCASPARWRIEDTSPGDHYCEAHKAEHLENLAEGPSMEVDRLESDLKGTSLFEIERDETCEEVMKEGGMCGQEAKWVFVETLEIDLCERHATEWSDQEEVVKTT